MTDLARVACLEEAGSAVEDWAVASVEPAAESKKLSVPMGTSAIVSGASKGQRGRICRRWQADSWWYAPCLVELTLAGRLVAWSVCYGRMLQLDSNLE
jgi:hypothetical protein